jgi:hypothetical protein
MPSQRSRHCRRFACFSAMPSQRSRHCRRFACFSAMPSQRSRHCRRFACFSAMPSQRSRHCRRFACFSAISSLRYPRFQQAMQDADLEFYDITRASRQNGCSTCYALAVSMRACLGLRQFQPMTKASLACSPSKGEGSVNNAPPPSPHGWWDLLAFIAVLVTGISLIVFGHVTVVGLPMACAALVGLFAAWRGRGGR